MKILVFWYMTPYTLKYEYQLLGVFVFLYQYIRSHNQEVRNLSIVRYQLITYKVYIFKFYTNNINR